MLFALAAIALMLALPRGADASPRSESATFRLGWDAYGVQSGAAVDRMGDARRSTAAAPASRLVGAVQEAGRAYVTERPRELRAEIRRIDALARRTPSDELRRRNLAAELARIEGR